MQYRVDLHVTAARRRNPCDPRPWLGELIDELIRRADIDRSESVRCCERKDICTVRSAEELLKTLR